jgi:hypothetical protein
MWFSVSRWNLLLPSLTEFLVSKKLQTAAGKPKTAAIAVLEVGVMAVTSAT